jgi:CheY-like chemotaxis protein
MTPNAPLVAHKVFLVDDDDAVRGLMTTVLERKGFAVVAAANVTEALKHIAGENPQRTATLSFPPLPWRMASCDINKATRRQCWCTNHGSCR